MTSLLRKVIELSKIKNIFVAIFKINKGKIITTPIFKANDISNGFIKCEWGKITSLPLKKSKLVNYLIAIRIYQLNQDTKHFELQREMEISKKLTFCFVPIQSLKGNIKVELGYRFKNSNWKIIAEDFLDCYFNLDTIGSYSNDSDWFSEDSETFNNNTSQHQRIYQMSLLKYLGGTKFLSDGITHSGSN